MRLRLHHCRSGKRNHRLRALLICVTPRGRPCSSGPQHAGPGNALQLDSTKKTSAFTEGSYRKHENTRLCSVGALNVRRGFRFFQQNPELRWDSLGGRSFRPPRKCCVKCTISNRTTVLKRGFVGRKSVVFTKQMGYYGNMIPDRRGNRSQNKAKR